MQKFRPPHKWWSRRIRTTQERKSNPHKAKGEAKLWRTKRNSKNLPTTWDEIWIKIPKSWKKQRRTQYHPVDMFEK